jgi:hypothetical protein
MAKQFRDEPVQFVMATDTYGYFEEHAALTPDQEAAYDTAYFFGRHRLPVTLAISTPATHADNEGRVHAEQTENDRAYQVTVLPQTIIVDRHGIVRAVLVGWSPLNERFIVGLLKDMI